MGRAALLPLLVVSLLGCHDVPSMRRGHDIGGLIKALEDPEPRVRIQAVDSLGVLSHPRATQFLIKALDDPDPFVREHAARNLGCTHKCFIGCETTVVLEPLEKALFNDPDPWVRLEAARSLGSTKRPIVQKALIKAIRSDTSLDVRRVATKGLGKLRERSIDPVLKKLMETDPEPLVKAAAAEALRELVSSRPLTLDNPEPGLQVELGIESEQPDSTPSDDSMSE